MTVFNYYGTGPSPPPPPSPCKYRPAPVIGCVIRFGSIDPPSALNEMKRQPLTTREIQARIDAPPKSDTVQIAGCDLRYTWYTSSIYIRTIYVIL